MGSLAKARKRANSSINSANRRARDTVHQGGRFASASQNASNKDNTARLQGESTFEVRNNDGSISTFSSQAQAQEQTRKEQILAQVQQMAQQGRVLSAQEQRMIEQKGDIRQRQALIRHQSKIAERSKNIQQQKQVALQVEKQAQKLHLDTQAKLKQKEQQLIDSTKALIESNIAWSKARKSRAQIRAGNPTARNLNKSITSLRTEIAQLKSQLPGTQKTLEDSKKTKAQAFTEKAETISKGLGGTVLTSKVVEQVKKNRQAPSGFGGTTSTVSTSNNNQKKVVVGSGAVPSMIGGVNLFTNNKQIDFESKVKGIQDKLGFTSGITSSERKQVGTINGIPVYQGDDVSKMDIPGKTDEPGSFIGPINKVEKKRDQFEGTLVGFANKVDRDEIEEPKDLKGQADLFVGRSLRPYYNLFGSVDPRIKEETKQKLEPTGVGKFIGSFFEAGEFAITDGKSGKPLEKGLQETYDQIASDPKRFFSELPGEAGLAETGGVAVKALTPVVKKFLPFGTEKVVQFTKDNPTGEVVGRIITFGDRQIGGIVKNQAGKTRFGKIKSEDINVDKFDINAERGFEIGYGTPVSNSIYLSDDVLSRMTNKDIITKQEADLLAKAREVIPTTKGIEDKALRGFGDTPFKHLDKDETQALLKFVGEQKLTVKGSLTQIPQVEAKAGLRQAGDLDVDVKSAKEANKLADGLMKALNKKSDQQFTSVQGKVFDSKGNKIAEFLSPLESSGSGGTPRSLATSSKPNSVFNTKIPKKTLTVEGVKIDVLEKQLLEKIKSAFSIQKKGDNAFEFGPPEFRLNKDVGDTVRLLESKSTTAQGQGQGVTANRIDDFVGDIKDTFGKKVDFDQPTNFEFSVPGIADDSLGAIAKSQTGKGSLGSLSSGVSNQKGTIPSGFNSKGSKPQQPLDDLVSSSPGKSKSSSFNLVELSPSSLRESSKVVANDVLGNVFGGVSSSPPVKSPGSPSPKSPSSPPSSPPIIPDLSFPGSSPPNDDSGGSPRIPLDDSPGGSPPSDPPGSPGPDPFFSFDPPVDPPVPIEESIPKSIPPELSPFPGFPGFAGFRKYMKPGQERFELFGINTESPFGIAPFRGIKSTGSNKNLEKLDRELREESKLLAKADFTFGGQKILDLDSALFGDTSLRRTKLKSGKIVRGKGKIEKDEFTGESFALF